MIDYDIVVIPEMFCDFDQVPVEAEEVVRQKGSELGSLFFRQLGHGCRPCDEQGATTLAMFTELFSQRRFDIDAA